MKLKRAFEVVPGDVVAFIGAGGKTSLMVGLGYELAEAGWRVLATTTASLSQDQLSLFPCAMPCTADPQWISRALNEHQFVLLHEEIQGGRIYGPSLEWTEQLLDRVDSDIVLVEADDAAGLPFKAPRADEPQMPLETSVVVLVASLSALGVPLDGDHIYNPQAMIDRYGFLRNSPVKSPWLAQVLRDEELGLRGVPPEARVVIYLNQTPERGFMRGRARMIARLSLQSERISAVALGAVRAAQPVYEVQRSVGALVLATGDDASGDLASLLRPGSHGTASVAQVTERLMRSRLDHIRVVTGHGARDVRAALKALGVKTVQNRSSGGGIVASLKAGLGALPPQVAAVLIAPGGQARIQPKVIYQILTAYARGEGDFIIPRYGARGGHPILLGKRFWAEILNMPRRSDWAAICRQFESAIMQLSVQSDSILYGLPGELDYLPDRQAANITSRGP